MCKLILFCIWTLHWDYNPSLKFALHAILVKGHIIPIYFLSPEFTFFGHNIWQKLWQEKFFPGGWHHMYCWTCWFFFITWSRSIQCRISSNILILYGLLSSIFLQEKCDNLSQGLRTKDSVNNIFFLISSGDDVDEKPGMSMVDLIMCRKNKLEIQWI